MIRLTQLMGQNTINLADAERTGKVNGIRVQGDRVVAVHTGDTLIEAGSIRSFEGDAVTYDGAPSTPGDVKADDPRARRVLDEEGDELGRLADLEIEADGTITNVLLDDGRTLSGSQLRAIGSYAVIVAAQPDTTPTTDSSGPIELPPPPEGSTPA